MRASRILPKNLRFQEEKSAERWSKLVPAPNLRWSSQHFRLKTQDTSSRMFQAGDWCIPSTASCLSPKSLSYVKISHNSWLIRGYMQLVYHEWRFEVYIISLPISQPQLFSHLQRIAQKHPWSDEVSFGEGWSFTGRWGQSATLGRSTPVISKQSGVSHVDSTSPKQIILKNVNCCSKPWFRHPRLLQKGWFSLLAKRCKQIQKFEKLLGNPSVASNNKTSSCM